MIEVRGLSSGTVKEIMDVLKKVPSEYELSFAGESAPAIMIDHDEKTVLIDALDYIRQLVNEY